MSLRGFDQSTGLLHRVSGRAEAPVVVYLPGVHGDWTAQTAARPVLTQGLRLIEVAYPRTAAWNLEEFASALGALLDELGQRRVHLVGDSFGSLVAWQFALHDPQRVRSLVLVGGFCQPPRFRLAASAGLALHLMPTPLLELGITAYVNYCRSWRGRCFDLDDGTTPYAATRTLAGRVATARRMAIIQQTDFRSQLHRVSFPVRYVGGAWDRIVPVRREVRTLNTQLAEPCRFESHLIPRAPHAIIATHPLETAQRIAAWLAEVDRGG